MWFIHRKGIAALVGNYHRWWQPWIAQISGTTAAPAVDEDLPAMLLATGAAGMTGGMQPSRGGMQT